MRKTGKVRWYFNSPHHDMWDYDAEAAPTLMDITQNGKKIPVVIAVSKPGLMFFLDRETGKSIYGMEERPFLQSDIPGEEAWPTQPFPLKPPPLTRQGRVPDEVFKGEPEHEKFCKDLVEKIGGIHSYGSYTPYSSKEFRVIFPGQQGGPNYGGVAVDPKLGYVIVNARNVAGMGRLDKRPENDPVAYRRFSPLGAGTRQRALLGSIQAAPVPAAALGGADGGEREYGRHRLAHSAGDQRRDGGQGHP